MRRWRRRLGQAVAVAMILSMALATAFAWRLTTGPIALPALTPRLERALSRSDGSWVTHIAASEIAWDAAEREIDLRVRDLRVDAGGEELLRLPVASLKFSAWALLGGRLVLRAVELPNPHVTLRRGPDGALSVALAGEPAEESSFAEVLLALAETRPGGPLAELRRIEVSGGELTMVGEGDRSPWRLTAVEWTLARTPEGLSVSGVCRFERGATTMPIRVDAALDAGAEPATFRASLSAGALTPQDALALWPAATASDVRDWVSARVEGGSAHDLDVTLRGRIGSDGTDLDAIDGRFAFAGSTVRPLDGVAPLTGVTGRASFDRDRWRFEVARGQSGGLEVVDGTADIASSAPASVAIRAAVRGPLERALPLAAQYTKNATLAAAPATGRLDAALRLDLRLGRAFDLRRDFAAHGQATDVAWPKLVGEHSLAAGTFTFEITDRFVTVRGAGAVREVPVEVVVATPLDRYDPRIDVSTRLDAAARAKLGLELRPWVDGPIPVQAKLAPRGTATTAAVAAELRGAVLSVPALGIEKPAGVGGSAEATLVVDGGAIRAVDAAVLRYGATRLNAHWGYDRSGALASLDLDGTLGPVPGRASPSALTLRIVPGPATRTITAVTDDVDLLFRALGMNADAEGGTLRFDGTLAAGSSVALEGQAEARDFALASAPTLARLLAMASVPGVTNLFAGRGLPVTRLAAYVDYRAPRITLRDGVLESPSLGMRLAGTIETGGAIACHGSLVPSYYGLNTLPGRVPVLGRVFTGGKQEGLQVFEFDVRGTTAAPKITVDPVSSLAPGVMRDLLKLLPRPSLPVLRR